MLVAAGQAHSLAPDARTEHILSKGTEREGRPAGSAWHEARVLRRALPLVAPRSRTRIRIILAAGPRRPQSSGPPGGSLDWWPRMGPSMRGEQSGKKQWPRVGLPARFSARRLDVLRCTAEGLALGRRPTKSDDGGPPLAGPAGLAGGGLGGASPRRRAAVEGAAHTDDDAAFCRRLSLCGRCAPPSWSAVFRARRQNRRREWEREREVHGTWSCKTICP